MIYFIATIPALAVAFLIARGAVRFATEIGTCPLYGPDGPDGPRDRHVGEPVSRDLSDGARATHSGHGE